MDFTLIFNIKYFVFYISIICRPLEGPTYDTFIFFIYFFSFLNNSYFVR